MKSMTGYGRGEFTQGGFKITAEVNSVNRKQTEVNVYLPRELTSLEPRVRNEVNRKVARGRLTIRFDLHAGEDGASSGVRLNVALAKAYARELRKLAQELRLKEDLTLDILARAPGVFRTDEEITDAERFWPAVEKSLQQSLEGLIVMRVREGAHLAEDLGQRVAIMRKSLERIRKRAPAMVKHYRKQLLERIKAAGLAEVSADDERLRKEIVFFADRSDITEELTRLESHFRQFDESVVSTEPVGRTLDFLAQEINREVNTVGSKATDSLIAKEVVTMKAELERFREQVQNVE